MQLSTCKSDTAVEQLFESLTAVEECDCLIEGLKKDQISHFILRYHSFVNMYCDVSHNEIQAIHENSFCKRRNDKKNALFRLICCNDAEMREWFVSSELTLFYHRLSCMQEKELGKIVRPLQV